jgi:hypothetical protein
VCHAGQDQGRRCGLSGEQRDEVGLRIVTIIDTGNKSLHAWAERPPADVLAQLVAMAPGLGIDAGALTHSAAPVRLPGCIHQITGRPARLLYCEL